jgi:ACS family hexuronate transporter-like MFS transporter
MGIINAGTAVGAVVAPPLVAFVLSYANWRSIFVLTGAIGFAWTIWWFRTYSPAAVDTDTAASATVDAPHTRWTELVRMRQVLGLVLAKFLSDAAWYFYLFWLPKYLYDARGFDFKGIGALAWIPNAAAGIGCVLGGWFSSYLIRRELSLNAARKVALGLSAAVMPLIILVPSASVGWAIALFCLAYFGQQSWSTLVMVLPADLFPAEVVGSVAGLVGFGGAMGGIVFGQLAGYLLDHGFGYGTVFKLAGSFHVIAFLVILAAIPRVQPLRLGHGLGYEGAR